MTPDFMFYTPDNKLLLAAEVKASRDEDVASATRLRRNLIVHGIVPDSPYFLLVYPEHFYLWRNSPAMLEAPPDFIGSTTQALQPYLGRFSQQTSRLSESSLELAVKAWLYDVASRPQREEVVSDAADVLEISGLADQLRHGAQLYAQVL
jgi:hypothetical protein